MVHIDGSFGEGGGQILRTALSLSSITGLPFKITRIRRNRARPGLMTQHLACIKAAGDVCSAEVVGASKGSQELTFHPGIIRNGQFCFTVETAGSALLVFQTVFPILAYASGESEIDMTGGTHNPMAPPFEFVNRIFLPAVSDLGFSAEIELVRHGFYPRGGGILRARIYPRTTQNSLEMLVRGSLKEMRPLVLIADLDREIAKREARVLGRELKRSSLPAKILQVPPGEGPGNVILLEAGYGSARCLFSAFGRKGLRAEAVALSAVKAWQAHHRLEVPVQPELADQLLLPMALAGKGSFLAGRLSEHARTNIHVIEAFLAVTFSLEEDKAGRIRVDLKKP